MVIATSTSIHNGNSIMIPYNKFIPSMRYTKTELKALVKAFNQVKDRNAARFILDMIID